MARKSSSPKLSPAQLDEVCRLFSVLSDSSRLRILNTLMHSSNTVGELVEILELGQANVSKHLTQLHHAGLIARKKEGTRVRYSIASPLVEKLCKLVCESVAQKASERLRLLAGR